MLTTTELNAATRALVYPHSTGNRSDRPARDAALAKYRADEKALEAEWALWLGDEYAGDLPASVHAEIYRRAWNDGHSEGYYAVESRYEEYAEFAIMVRDNTFNRA